MGTFIAIGIILTSITILVIVFGKQFKITDTNAKSA